MPKEISPREKSLREAITSWERRIAKGETNPYIENYPEYMKEQLAHRQKQLAELLSMSPSTRARDEARFKQLQEEEAEIESEADEDDDGEESESDRVDRALAKFEKEHPVKKEEPRGKTLDRFVSSVEKQLDNQWKAPGQWKVVNGKWVKT